MGRWARCRGQKPPEMALGKLPSVPTAQVLLCLNIIRARTRPIRASRSSRATLWTRARGVGGRAVSIPRALRTKSSRHACLDAHVTHSTSNDPTPWHHPPAWSTTRPSGRSAVRHQTAARNPDRIERSELAWSSKRHSGEGDGVTRRGSRPTRRGQRTGGGEPAWRPTPRSAPGSRGTRRRRRGPRSRA